MSTVAFKLPRVNLVAIISGVLGLISMTLPWWGISGFGISLQWGLFTQPTSCSAIDTTSLDRALGQYSLIVIVLALVSIGMAVLGSVYQNDRILIGGLTGYASSLIVYPIAVYFAIVAAEAGTSCQSSSSCLGGPLGSSSGITWGFQIGYYVFITSAILLLVGIVFHRFFVQPGTREQGVSKPSGMIGRKYCSNCASPLPSAAKFCPNCASPISSA